MSSVTQSFFITGTDTGVGKTRICLSLMAYWRAQGKRVVGMKPVASGSELTAEGLRNDDALQLQQASSVSLPYADINPYVFAPAIAPHIAAQQSNIHIDLTTLSQQYTALCQLADVVCIEGAGGWRLPLHCAANSVFLSDFAATHALQVILVVGLRLGCLNHAVLTAEAIQRSGPCRLVGWIANHIDPAFAALHENISALQTLIAAPYLGYCSYDPTCTPQQLARELNLDLLV